MSDGRSRRDKGKTAIVTAASSGMGATCARELASRGYAVALMSTSGKAEALAKDLEGLGLARGRSRRWMTLRPSSAKLSTGTLA
jgi:NAD(P)-dependent dehydrogenase (short-subunit alcohol dehydrogenase family)